VIRRPQTPADHYAEAVALVNDAADLPPSSPAALVYAVRAAAHASLALYSPPSPPMRYLTPGSGLFDATDVLPCINAGGAPEADTPAKKTTARRPRKAAAPKETTE